MGLHITGNVIPAEFKSFMILLLLFKITKDGCEKGHSFSFMQISCKYLHVRIRDITFLTASIGSIITVFGCRLRYASIAFIFVTDCIFS